MTTTTITHPVRPAIRWAFLFLLAVIGIGAVMAIKVISQPHAESRHGEEVATVRKSCDEKEPYQIWRNRDGKTFYQLCQLPDDRYGIRAIIKDGEDWVEKTSFIPKDGTLAEVMKYLEGFATRYTAPLP